MLDANEFAMDVCHWAWHWVEKHMEGVSQRLARLGMAHQKW